MVDDFGVLVHGFGVVDVHSFGVVGGFRAGVTCSTAILSVWWVVYGV